MLVSIWSINDKETIIDEFICIKRNCESVKKKGRIKGNAQNFSIQKFWQK